MQLVRWDGVDARSRKRIFWLTTGLITEVWYAPIGCDGWGVQGSESCWGCAFGRCKMLG
jgi:hypothetical protein